MQDSYKILIIEDNPDIVANIFAFFEPKGYELDNAYNGLSGLKLATQNTYNIILLDVMLPGMNGTQLCKTLRDKWHNTTPVLMLTARDTILDKVVGLESGADDYLVKPFSLVELEARIKALIRRHHGDFFEHIFTVGDLILDPQKHIVYREGVSIKVTPTGFKILSELMRESPRVIKKNDLEQRIWGMDIPSSDALRTHLYSLRQQVDKPFYKPMIITISGIGYQIIDPNVSSTHKPH